MIFQARGRVLEAKFDGFRAIADTVRGRLTARNKPKRAQFHRV